MIKSKVCLLPMITPASREWTRLHIHYRNHLLPLAGGIYDQPAAYLDAMELIETTP